LNADTSTPAWASDGIWSVLPRGRVDDSGL
jgi:hypothetical protein